MPTPPRKPALPNVVPVVVLVLLLAVAYVLSYAPVVRWSLASSGLPLMDGQDFPAYRPVDWLIDKTPLRRPLFLWADVWHVRFEFEISALIRTQSAMIHWSDPGSVILDR
jgi:hypothetical protein